MKEGGTDMTTTLEEHTAAKILTVLVVILGILAGVRAVFGRK